MWLKLRRTFRRLLETLVALVIIISIFILVYSVPQLEPNYHYYATYGLLPELDLFQNYFEPWKQQDFLVDNRKCQIPKLSILNDHVEPFYTNYSDRSNRSPPVCHHKKFKFSPRNVTFVDRQFIRVNEEALLEMGFTKDNVSCCYRTVERVEQNLSSYDRDADNGNEFSANCCPINGQGTVPISSFIKVTCYEINHGNTIYTKYHLVGVLPPPGNGSANISRKLEHWKQCLQGESNKSVSNCSTASWNNGRPPLSVLVIGLDSTSRLNFRRAMPQATAVLEHDFQAVEMKGYTKVGDNTFPNFVPILSSLSVKELIRTCYPKRWTPFDNCPFIWKEFSKRNYLTAHIEDLPSLANLNYERTGFIHAPVDIYARNWMISWYNYRSENAFIKKCSRPESLEKEVLEYVVNLADLSASRGMPFFILTWLTELTHTDMNAAQVLDSTLASDLLELKARGLLESTLVLVMGDHGYRYGDYRTTISGWYEDKLPTLWVKVPEKLTTQLKSLKNNSDKLTSPYDIHATFRDILNLAPGVRGQSLLKSIPERSCKEAGVPLQYCPCETPLAFEKKIVVFRGANAAVRYINHKIPSVCLRLKLALIFASGKVRGDIGEQETDKFYLHIGFVTQPGEFRFEALVAYENEEDTSPRVISVQRTNRIIRSVRCLEAMKDNEYEFIELICFCKRSYTY